MGTVKIEPPNFGGYLDWHLSGASIRGALPTAGDAMLLVTWRTAGGADEAGPFGFRGAPVILVGGRAHFARPADPARRACRVYPAASGGQSRIVGSIQAVPADAA
jgi:hypothetical protein